MRARVCIAVAAACLIIAATARAQTNPQTALLIRDGFRLLADEPHRAAELFRDALALEPKNGLIHMGAGLAAFAERRDDDAKAELQRAIELNPQLAEAYEALGLVLRRQGDLIGAIRTYETLLASHRDRRAAAETLERWRREFDLQNRMRSEVGNHFTVAFEGPEQAELASRALESLESAYWRVGDLLGGVYPVNPISVVLYTREQFRDITRSPSWAAGTYDGIVRVPMRGALDKPAELDRVLAHEFTHALVRSLAPSGVPAWLNEGLAAAVESPTLAWADERIQRAGGSIPLNLLTRSFGRLNGAEAELAYASSAFAVNRMIQDAGGYAVANLLRDLGSGVDIESAFARRIQQPLAQFSASLAK